MRRNFTHESAFIVASCLLGLTINLTSANPKPDSQIMPSGQSAPVIKNEPAPKKILDSGAVHKYYLDGDFEEAIALIEASLKQSHSFSHDDSVFIFKHLGVMYAARYETREKGKYFMHQLLMTEPTAKIMDMYASDMIYMIFKNIQDEFESNRFRLDHAKQLVSGNAQTDANANGKGNEGDSLNGKGRKVGGSGRNLAYWWIGGVALAAGIGGGYYLLNQEPTREKDKEVIAR